MRIQRGDTGWAILITQYEPVRVVTGVITQVDVPLNRYIVKCRNVFDTSDIHRSIPSENWFTEPGAAQRELAKRKLTAGAE